MTYAAREASRYSGQPVELYRFTCGSSLYCYTSADSSQTYGGQTFAPVRIVRGTIDNSNEDSRGELELRSPGTIAVAQLFVPDLPVSPVTLELFRFHRGDSEVIKFWSGEVSSVSFQESEAVITALPDSRRFREQVPSLCFGAQCQWQQYSPQCTLNKATFKVTGTLSLVSGLTIRSSAFAAFPNGYFATGWVEIAGGERHWITDHVGDTLTLMTRFRSLLAGASVDAYPSCQRAPSICGGTFSNLNNFLGFPYVPTKNPFIQGIG